MFYAIDSPFIVTNFTLEQLIRGDGRSIDSMVGMVVSVAVNIIFDPVLSLSVKNLNKEKIIEILITRIIKNVGISPILKWL